MTFRPRIFEEMASQFSDAFGNCDAVFTIDGVAGAPVRVIARTTVNSEMAEESGHAVEAAIDDVRVAATSVPGLTSQRDTMTIGPKTYGIGNIDDDGRAMLKLTLTEKLT